jgi:hypothetical protein
MRNLKSSLLLLLFISLFSSCQSTKPFRIETFSDQKGDLHIIHANSDRVRQRCLFLNAEGGNIWRHQYFIYVLNDKEEVLEIMKSTNSDRDSCQSQVQAVAKILVAEPTVRICARDELRRNQDLDAPADFISFNSLGRHKVIHEGLTFDTICNSKKCVGDNSAWIDTCPGFVKHE